MAREIGGRVAGQVFVRRVRVDNRQTRVLGIDHQDTFRTQGDDLLEEVAVQGFYAVRVPADFHANYVRSAAPRRSMKRITMPMDRTRRRACRERSRCAPGR